METQDSSTPEASEPRYAASGLVETGAANVSNPNLDHLAPLANVLMAMESDSDSEPDFSG